MIQSGGKVLSRMLVFLLIASANSCTKRPTRSETVHYRVYVSVRGIERGVDRDVYVIDPVEDSVIDSLDLPTHWDLPILSCDPIGSVFAVSHGTEFRFFDAGSRSAFLTKALDDVRIAFAHSPDNVIGTRGSVGGVVPARLNIYDLSDLSILHSDTIGFIELELDAASNRVFGIIFYSNLGGPPFATSLGCYDYAERRLCGVRNIFPGRPPDQTRLRRLAIHPNGNLVYLSVDTDAGARLLCYNWEEDSTRFDLPMFGAFGEPEVTADGTELWYPDPGGSTSPEHILVLDALTGETVGRVDLSSYRPHPSEPLRPYQLRFSPDGDWCYTASGTEAGPVFEIDSETRGIRSIIPCPDNTAPVFIGISPLP